MRKKRWILCWGVLLFSGLLVHAQPQYAFRIAFTDKTGSPAANLTQRALDRRTNQGISLNDADRPVSPDYIDSVLTLTGGKLHLTSRWLNYMVLLLYDSSKIAAVENKPYVSRIEYISYYSTALHKGNKPPTKAKKLKILKTTGNAAYYGQTYDQTALVNGDYLHDQGYKGEGIFIAVFDEGFLNVKTATGFDSMNQEGRLLDSYNFPNANDNIVSASHGTSALSVMAGNIPGTFVGAAPHADYAIYSTEINSSEQYLEMDNMVAATERADSMGVDIISVSLGYWDFSGLASPALKYVQINGDSTVAAKAANIATAKGMLFVASAGNDGQTIWKYILTPGDADSAMTVGACNMSKVVDPNSGFGPNSSGRRKPDVLMPGPTAYLSDGNIVSKATATSWSTPQLAGWAACLWQAVGPKVTPYQLKQAIIKSAHMYAVPDNHSGWGVPDFKKALELLSIDEAPPARPDKWAVLQPNPVEDDIILNVYTEHNTEVQVRVVDITGRTVLESTHLLDSGIHKVIMPAGPVLGGVYLLKVAAGDKETAIRMVKR